MQLATRFVAAILLFSVLCSSVAGQEPQLLTPQQIRQINKVRKNLTLFGAGIRLDVRVNSGFHYTGRLGQMGSTSFTLTDAVLNKPLAIDYLDVKRRFKPNPLLGISTLTQQLEAKSVKPHYIRQLGFAW